MKVIVIIPAAGLGSRMASGAKAGKSLPSKQFAEICGAPILIHTLQKFCAAPSVSEIYIALREKEIPAFQSRLERQKLAGKERIRLVAGGDHRQHSVAKALATISAASDDVVLVHDAVRPLVTQQMIQDVIEAVRKYGAAIAALPAVDTVKQVDRTSDGAIVTTTMPRERLVMAQTPQGFRYDVLKRAFDDAAADGFLGTDESSLVERSGREVAVVMGSPRNIKITTPADLELAEFYLQRESHLREGDSGELEKKVKKQEMNR